MSYFPHCCGNLLDRSDGSEKRFSSDYDYREYFDQGKEVTEWWHDMWHQENEVVISHIITDSEAEKRLQTVIGIISKTTPIYLTQSVTLKIFQRL